MGDWVTDLVMPWNTSSTERAQQSADKAINAQTTASDKTLQLQQDQFDYQKSLQQPFYQGSLPAYYSMVDAITGQRQTYQDPNYTELTGREAAQQAYAKLQQDKSIGSADYWKDIGNGEDPVSRLMRDPTMSTLTKGYYRGPNGEITTTPPKITTEAFNPTETDAYKWQQSQNEKNNSRTLRALGRENSSYGMGEQFKSNQTLAASEYDKQLGRLADLTNIARGGSSSLAAASTGYTNSAGQNMLNQGNNLANASLAGGMLQQNGLYNNQQNLSSLANLGLKTYNAGKNEGWWGGTGNSSGYDAGPSSAGIQYGNDTAVPYEG